MVGQDNITVASVAECIASGSDVDHFFDLFGQFIWLWFFKARAKRIVIIRCFLPRLSPFTSIIQARDSRHTHKQSVCQRNMFLIRQNACQSCNIMIIHKCHQVLSSVNTPLITSELAVQGMCDLEHIHTVKAGI